MRPADHRWTITLALLVAGAAAAAAPAAGRDSLLAGRAAAYFAAFNSGEPAMRDFITGHFAAGALASRTLEERIATYRQMQQNLVSLTPRRSPEIAGNSLTVATQAAKGDWLRLDFQFEPGPEGKLLGIRIQPMEAPLDPSLPKLPEPQVLDSVDAFLSARAARDSFSGAVLLARAGRQVYARALGLASREFGVPSGVDTRFNLGSINKLFTKIAIGQLITQGRLAFDDSLGKYLADYPNAEARSKVTIRHLLDMTSGIGDFFSPEFAATPKDRIRTIADYLPLFSAKPLAFEPGSQRLYSNGGYVVLGAIIEKVTGRSYYDYVRENIFRPAGMNSTDSYEADMPVSNLAMGYTRAGNTDEAIIDPHRREETIPRSNIYTRPARGSSAGGGYSTVTDLLKFTIALNSNRLMPPEFTNWIFTDQEPGTAPGTAGPRDLLVAGGAPGINAVLRMDDRKDFVTIVLTNLDPPCAMATERRIQSWLSRIEN